MKKHKNVTGGQLEKNRTGGEKIGKVFTSKYCFAATSPELLYACLHECVCGGGGCCLALWRCLVSVGVSVEVCVCTRLHS